MIDEQKPGAWAVVAFAEMGPNRLTLVAYAVAVSSEDEAIELVKAQSGIGPDGEVREAARVSPETVQSLALRPGEVRML